MMEVSMCFIAGALWVAAIALMRIAEALDDWRKNP